MVLSKFSVDVIKAVTDPYSGLPSRKTESGYGGMPDVADVREACDDEAARIARMDRYRALPAPDFNLTRLSPPPAAPGDKATVFVPRENPRYAALVEWSKTADPRLWKFDGRPGIVVSYDTWDQRNVTARIAGPMPDRLALSEDARRRVMADVEAERSRNLPIDQHHEAAE